MIYIIDNILFSDLLPADSTANASNVLPDKHALLQTPVQRAPIDSSRLACSTIICSKWTPPHYCWSLWAAAGARHSPSKSQRPIILSSASSFPAYWAILSNTPRICEQQLEIWSCANSLRCHRWPLTIWLSDRCPWCELNSRQWSY